MRRPLPSTLAVATLAVATVLGACGSPREPGAVGPSTTAVLTSQSLGMVVVAEGIDQPVEIAWRGEPPMAYVATREGTVVPLTPTGPGPAVLDLRAEVNTEAYEQGMLGLAFHPTEPFAYVDYTRLDGDTVIAEFAIVADGTWDGDNPRTVLVLDQPSPNHNGGNLAFGPDGFLYIGMGDGADPADPGRRALDLGDPLGKILRIDPRPTVDGEPYGIPADNPFVGTDGARPYIWAYGLRNPWRFSFDSATGDLWVGDVGQASWEEVSVARSPGDGAPGGRGVSFGWSAFEGSHRLNDDQVADDAVLPLYEYPHADENCAVTGGEVYHGTAIPSLVGWYVFGDWCSGRVWALPASTPDGTPPQDVRLVDIGRPGTATSVRTGPDGELYVVGLSTGHVHRIVAA